MRNSPLPAAGSSRTPAFAAITLAFLLVLVTGSLMAPGKSAGAVIEHSVEAAPSKVESSWDRADYLAAEPLDTPAAAKDGAFDIPQFPAASTSAATGDFIPSDSSKLPERLHGKVFFRIGVNRYACSGTLVNSATGSSIFTAGHCVFDADTKQFVTDFVFVPGYRDGLEPLGSYPATALATTQGWANRGDLSYDIGVASLGGTPAADLGGSEKIAFNQKPSGRKYTIYGYPAEPSSLYNGETLIGCRSESAGRDRGKPRPIVAYPCRMAQGASGGGWMSGGYLNAVFSYIYCDDSPETCGYVFASYFSNAALSLYTSSTVGGSVTPTVKVAFSPPAKVRKRKVVFRLGGDGSTPLSFRCKFDRQPFVDCGARVTISRLTIGKHELKVRSIDQTGRLSAKTLSQKFKVLGKR